MSNTTQFIKLIKFALAEEFKLDVSSINDDLIMEFIKSLHLI